MAEDEEISIDLSKLAFWKKKKPKKNEETEKPEHKAEEKEDFDKEIEAAEKKEEKRKKEKEGTKEEEFSLDIKSIGQFLYKHRAVFLLIIPIFLMIMFRMYPSNLPVTDDWAKNSVNNYYTNLIKQQISQQYPNLPDANKNALVQEQLQQFMKENKDQVNAQIKQTSQYFKDQLRDENGYTYLGDIDSYVWLREAENIVNNGHVGDTLVNGQPYDSLIKAPYGDYLGANLYPYVEAYLYTFLHFFNKQITVMRAAFYTPFLFSLLAIIAAFFLARKIAGTIGGLFASIMVAIHPFFLSRTFGSDTDPMVVTFPLLIVWMFVEAIEAKNIKKGLVFALLAGFFEGVYAFGWVFWYVFDFILGAIILYIIYHLIYYRAELRKGLRHYWKNTEIKNTAIVTLMFIVSTGIFVTLFVNFQTFLKGPVEPLNFLTLKQTVASGTWPNVYRTVAELNPASMSEAISNLGQTYLFVISLMGILLIMVRRKIGSYELLFLLSSFAYYVILTLNSVIQFITTKMGTKLYLLLLLLPVIIGFVWLTRRGEIAETSAKLAIIISIWYAATLFASLSGVRFLLLLVPVFALSFGIAIGIAHYHISRWISKNLDINRTLCKTAIMALMFTLLISTIQAAESRSKQELPIMNDAWYSALSEIRDTAAPDAIINSWWDFGHHFKYVAKRKVTFDGASQNTPLAHWIGKVLLTSDEKEAIGILRMLDCGANNAFEEVNKRINDTRHSVELLYGVIVLEKPEAKQKLLQKGFTDAEAEKILGLTHCNPPEDYFITSQDMVGKSGVWAHFGIWNFSRAEIWSELKDMNQEDAVKYMMKEEGMKYSREDAEKVYKEIKSITSETEASAWIAPWPSYGGTTQCNRDAQTELINCDNGILINTTNYETIVPTQTGIKQMQSVVYQMGDGLIEKKGQGDMIPFSLLLKTTGATTYEGIMMQPELALSVFTRLYFLEGFATDHFELFTHKQGFSGTNVYVWKVNWEGKSKTIKTTASKRDKASVNFIGYLADKTIFDSSIENWQTENITPETEFSKYKTSPLVFTVGAGQVIQGFDEAVIGMKLGEEKTIEIPPEKAYGTDPSAHSLGGKTLFFKIKVVKIE